MRSLLSVVVLLAACGPDNTGGGACKDTLIAGDLVITEVMADYAGPPGGSGADDGKEWFEIYNASDRAIELEGLTITHSRPDDSKAKTHVMGTVTIAPGQYLVLGNSGSDLLPPYVDYGFTADLGDFFNTDGGKLRLSCGDSEIDAATYEAIKSGRTRQLSAASPPDYTFNDTVTNWCEAADSEYEPNNFGTPGQDNDCTPVVIGACNDNGTMRAVVLPGAGDLVITEVMPSPAAVSDTVGEWFEVRVMAEVDLNGISLDRAGDTTKADVVTSPDCIHVMPGEHVIFVKNADPLMNGMLPAAAIKGTFKFSMVGGSVASPGDIQLLAGATVIDAVTWTSSANGASLALDPDLTDATANDAESNFCDGTAAYGAGDLGTPGAANAQCVLLPPAGMCSDGGTNRAIQKPGVGDLIITEILPNPAPPPMMDGTTDAQKEWFEIKNISPGSFDLNELTFKNPGNTGTTVASSDCIVVPSNGFALIARSADNTKNGGLPIPATTISFSIVDSGANATLQVFDGAVEIDSAAYTGVQQGTTLALDPDINDPAMNTFTVAAGVVCRGATAYGDLTNRGTPGAANEQCP